MPTPKNQKLTSKSTSAFIPPTTTQSSISHTQHLTVTAPPAKVKGFLAKIKEALLDHVKDDSSEVTPDQLFRGLLQLELLQRSMLVEAHIMDNVEAAAGMSLAETQPLLSAASSAMAGKVAEKLAQLSPNHQRPTYDPKAIQNAKQDLRFQSILAKDPEYWVLAEGYYQRAATFQPDVPVHWKKAWDCLAARIGKPICASAIPYVVELLRIAEAKKNAKRVTTLSLQLVDCYLDNNDDNENDSNKSLAVKAFLPKRKKPMPVSKRIMAADNILSKMTTTPDGEASSAYALSLNLRVQMIHSSDDLSKRNDNLISTGEKLWKQGAHEYGELLMNYVDHLLETAKQTGDWGDLVNFATMVVNTKDESANELVATHVGLTVPVIEWHHHGDISSDTLRITRFMLRDSLSSAEEAAEKSMAKRSTALKNMQCAITAIDCWLELRGETVEHRNPLSPSCEYAVKCGVAYLEFLVAWSGFRQIPWPRTLQSEARSLLQRARSAVSTVSDRLLLQLGEADTEGAAFDGGRVKVARRLYQSTLEAAKSESTNSRETHLVQLISTRCLIGLAEMDERDDTQLPDASESLQESLSYVESIESTEEASLHVWTSPGYLKSCVSFLTARARQINASILLLRGKPLEAEQILEDAVASAPGDPSANFGLGSFRLYKALYVQDTTPDVLKDAQVQLLKAAKLDSSKADPFALLGFWYEHKGDTKRAAGCYSKALLSNPAHPVAGRGLIRLAPTDALASIFDAAAQAPSTTSGWAWRAIGKKKAMEDGEDELAVIAFLKALRCHDIARSKSDLKAPFYKDPRSLSSGLHPEQAETLWDLAQCYRRLGRFTASLRTFNSAIDIAGSAVKPELLCDCAQVELQLGLLDEAEAKFSLGIDISKEKLIDYTLLAYGRAMTLHLMVRRDQQDGKSGAAYGHLMNAIACCNSISESKTLLSVNKLLGDLYSNGSGLPLDLFVTGTDTDNFEEKVSLVANGEVCYRTALDLTQDDDTRASLMTDIGSNILSRAQMLEFHDARGLWMKPTERVVGLYQEAAAAFQQAVDIMPILASAWCGLGCATICADPLLAQHAFIRAIELDKMSPDAYANLSFLYSKHKRFGASKAVSDALTEVADTPAMWINRALVLENESEDVAAKNQAADAFKAALQITKTPEALRGLAMTLGNDTESMCIVEQYLGLWGSFDLPAIMLHAAQQIGYATTCPSPYSVNIASSGAREIEGQTLNLKEGLEDDLNNSLDIKKFQDLARQCEEGKSLHVAISSDNLWSLQRQVLNNPQDASLWLRLTTELVVASSMKEAEKTSKRATELFSTCLRNGSCDAVQISESFCLEQWIQLAEQKKADYCCIKKLQQALVMDPSNGKARRALRMISI